MSFGFSEDKKCYCRRELSLVIATVGFLLQTALLGPSVQYHRRRREIYEDPYLSRWLQNRRGGRWGKTRQNCPIRRKG